MQPEQQQQQQPYTMTGPFLIMGILEINIYVNIKKQILCTYSEWQI